MNNRLYISLLSFVSRVASLAIERTPGHPGVEFGAAQ